MRPSALSWAREKSFCAQTHEKFGLRRISGFELILVELTNVRDALAVNAFFAKLPDLVSNKTVKLWALKSC